MQVKCRPQPFPLRPRVFSRRIVLALLMLLSAAAVRAAWPAGEPVGTQTRSNNKLRSRYVAIPQRADTDLRRRGAHLARKFDLPLIAEPGVNGVVIREFRK